ncbi:MAG: IPT/TIG domain-containing protein, partial [Candidatus Riflebacteria bacterium]|nr:IPT/TIG domain-containing protein [Candidatus Riflebacteria bacterium]
MTCTTPASSTSGPKALVVTSSTHGVSNQATFTYNVTPTISALDPNNGPKAGGTTIAVHGANFGGVISVTVGGTPATVLGSDTNTVTCTTPLSSTTGPKAVVVTSSTHGVSNEATFTYNVTPTISA